MLLAQSTGGRHARGFTDYVAETGHGRPLPRSSVVSLVGLATRWEQGGTVATNLSQ